MGVAAEDALPMEEETTGGINRITKIDMDLRGVETSEKKNGVKFSNSPCSDPSYKEISVPHLRSETHFA